jgi:cell division protein FtsI (penicillin-binding protein 3)
LSLAAWPPVSTDPDRPSRPEEMRIPALVDVFEPGSTFKAITAAAAIEEGLIKKSELFDGEKGKWKVSSITIHDHEPKKLMSFDEVWMYSSNIGSAKIGERIGNERLYQYARLFGFGVFPGCGLSCEAKGMLRPPPQWSGVSKYVVAFGQEVGVTALQMTGAYSAIANGGKLMEPKMIKAILSADDREALWQDSPAEVRRVISAETAGEVTRILERVVKDGTGQMAQVKWQGDVTVAGKTGTAQKFDNRDGRYHPELTLVSFCGFFPSRDPKFTMLVILDEPEGRRWGGLDAAPVFRRIAEQLAPMLKDDDLLAKSKNPKRVFAQAF